MTRQARAYDGKTVALVEALAEVPNALRRARETVQHEHADIVSLK